MIPRAALGVGACAGFLWIVIVYVVLCLPGASDLLKEAAPDAVPFFLRGEIGLATSPLAAIAGYAFARRRGAASLTLARHAITATILLAAAQAIFYP